MTQQLFCYQPLMGLYLLPFCLFAESCILASMWANEGELGHKLASAGSQEVIFTGRIAQFYE
jgi:hypothetical protein